MSEAIFHLRDEFITLDALLKAAGWADSGGAAKQRIVSGAVRVDGRVEVRRGAKIRAGQRVQMADREILLRGGTDAGPAA